MIFELERGLAGHISPSGILLSNIGRIELTGPFKALSSYTLVGAGFLPYRWKKLRRADDRTTRFLKV
ncbi:MAG: hypothetical protein QXI37_00565, partial [Thermoprotei archaeon]